MKKNYEIDMCNGPLFGKILAFSIPLMLSGILQLLFNAADTVVVGRFAGSTALAAVGTTSSLINLLVNLFIGFSVGANVLTARYYGARKEKEVSDTVHSAIFISLISGILLLIIGISITEQILIWMGTPDDVLPQAALYLKIYFIGMPVMLLYNFDWGYKTSPVLSHCRWYRQCDSESDFCRWIPAFRCRSRTGNCDFPGNFRSPDSPLSDETRWLLPPQSAKSPPGKRQNHADSAHRFSRRAAGRSILTVQCTDTVLRQFLWLCCHGRQYCGCKYRRIYLYGYEYVPPDCHELYQPEFWRREAGADSENFTALPWHGNGRRARSWNQRIP